MPMGVSFLLSLRSLASSFDRLATSRAKTIVWQQLAAAVRTKIDYPGLLRCWGGARSYLGLCVFLQKRQQGV